MAFAKISTAASGQTQLVAGQAGRTIRVHAFFLVAASAVTAKFQSGSTDLTGAMSMITGTPLQAQPAPLQVSARGAHFETNAGDDLNLNLGGAVQVSGWIEYSVRTV